MGEKRYAWAKIRLDTMNSNEEKIIRRQEGGIITISLFWDLLKLSLNNDGRFFTQAGEWVMPWTPETLSEDILGYSVEDIRKGLDILKKVGLIYEDDGIMRISHFERYVGSDTKDATRMREYRKRKAEEEQRNKQDASDIEDGLEGESDSGVAPASSISTPSNDSKPQATVGEVQSSTCNNNKTNNNSNNKVQQNSSSKVQKPRKDGFFNKKVKDEYQWFEGQVWNALDFKNEPWAHIRIYYDHDLCNRIISVAREVSRHESYTINSAPISSEQILKSFYNLIDVDGEKLYMAFQKLDELLRTTQVKNALKYTITFLYNESIAG